MHNLRSPQSTTNMNSLYMYDVCITIARYHALDKNNPTVYA